MKSTFTLITVVLILICPLGLSVEPTRKVVAKKSIGHAELYWLLNRACCDGDEIGVKMLLDAGADPNGIEDYKAFRRFEPSWPINQASWDGHLEVIELLLQAGAKVDFPEGEGFTALLIATMRNHPKVVARLVLAGADTNYKGPGGTALAVARAKGFSEIVQILETANASPKPVPRK